MNPVNPPQGRARGRGAGAQDVQAALHALTLQAVRRPESTTASSVRTDASNGTSAGRGASRGREGRVESAVIRTRPAGNFVKQGKAGTPMTVISNYFELTSRPDFHLLQYRVDFSPDVDHMGVRKALLRVHEPVLGKYVFDGTLLYNTKRLHPEPLELFSSRTSDGSNVRITFRLVGEIKKDDHVYNSIMNIIFRRCLAMLKLTEMKRDYFDMAAAQNIPAHNLTVVPGYFTTVHHHEDGYLLGVEIIHKLLRKDTAMDVMDKVRRNSGGDFKASIRAALEGQVVITHYNNKTYRIDDVDFDKNPSSTFHLRKEDRDITYAEYFKTRYNVTVRNMTQPLLMSRPSRRDVNRGDDQPVYLIPELSGMTGLSDEQRADFRLMKDVGDVTKLNPDRRVESLMKFRRRIAETPGIQEELTSWGLEFANELVRIPARVLEPKTIIQSTSYVVRDGDWSRNIQRNRYCVTVELRKWIVVFPSMMMADTQKFIATMKGVGMPHNFKMPDPVMVPIQNDRNNSYLEAIREECAKSDQIQMIVVILRTARADTYSAVKQLTLSDLGIPSQVLTGRILRGDDRKVMSVATKVTIQVASKLGAEPWRVQIPVTKWMVCGFDVYHDRKQSKAVGAFVASLNPSFTRYYSSVDLHKNNEEISPSFKQHMLRSLQAYYKLNKDLPEKIIVYRDGLGAGDTQRVKETEIAAIREACQVADNNVKKGRLPTIAFIVVSKRLNTRFFKDTRPVQNVDCGTVIDNKVTQNERYDFFLVSQKTTQGTASPTSYNIIEDTTGIAPDIHQKLANCLTDVYYNWPGSLRVPAPVQYAHKLAYLIGESGLKKPMDSIAHLPYYL